MKAFDFPFSLETHIIVTFRCVHDEYAHKITYYHTHMDKNRKQYVRKMCNNAFHEEFYFTPIDDTIIVLAKKNRTNGCATEKVKYVHNHYLSSLEGENLKQFLNRFSSC